MNVDPEDGDSMFPRTAGSTFQITCYQYPEHSNMYVSPLDKRRVPNELHERKLVYLTNSRRSIHEYAYKSRMIVC